MLEAINQWDHEMMIFLNGINSAFFDPIMVVISEKLTWIPLYLLLIFLIIKRFKKQGIIIILSLLLSVGAADVIASKIFKPTFERLRPCHDPTLTELLNTPAGCGGQFGFFSSHASTTFAVAFFVFLSFRERSKWPILMLVWSAVVSYSRIYLGAHFPLDVVFGALCGVLCAWLVYLAMQKNFPSLKNS